MQTRRAPLLLQPAAEDRMFRRLRPAVVVDIQYDDHTKSAGEPGGSPTLATLTGAVGSKEPASHQPGGTHSSSASQLQDKTELAATLHGPSSRLDRPLDTFTSRAPQIEVHWDPNEAPTRVCVGGDLLAMWRPSPAEPLDSNARDALVTGALRSVHEAPTERFSPTLPASLLLTSDGASSTGRSTRSVDRRTKRTKHDLPPLPSVLDEAYPFPDPYSAERGAPSSALSSIESTNEPTGAEYDTQRAPFEPDDELIYSPSQHLVSEQGGKRKRWFLPWLGGALIAITSGGTAYWIFSRPNTTEVLLETTPADAAVTIDGRVLPGAPGPRRTLQLPAGNHQLLVEKPGFTTQKQTLTLNTDPRGEPHSLSVALTQEVNSAKLAVSSNPTGAVIVVDGHETNLITPAVLSELSLGRHTVTLKREGYVDAEQTVRVPQDAMVSITLAKAQREQREREAAQPQAAPSEPQNRRAARTALRDDVRPALPLQNSETSQTTPAAVAAKDNTRAERAETEQDTRRVGSLAEAAMLTESVNDTGILQLSTRPSSEVYVDGEHVGRTPLGTLTLPAGRHTLRLENAPMNVRKTVEVTITAGKTVSRVEDLGK